MAAEALNIQSLMEKDRLHFRCPSGINRRFGWREAKDFHAGILLLAALVLLDSLRKYCKMRTARDTDRKARVAFPGHWRGPRTRVAPLLTETLLSVWLAEARAVYWRR